MLTCKLCNTTLTKKELRRDGSMLCPVCRQIYWKAAVDRALSASSEAPSDSDIRSEYLRESRLSTERIAGRVRRVRVA